MAGNIHCISIPEWLSSDRFTWDIKDQRITDDIPLQYFLFLPCITYFNRTTWSNRTGLSEVSSYFSVTDWVCIWCGYDQRDPGEWEEERSALVPCRSLHCPAGPGWGLSSGSEESFLLRLPDTHGTTCSVEEIKINKLIIVSVIIWEVY